jgi:hypothetical protein
MHPLISSVLVTVATATFPAPVRTQSYYEGTYRLALIDSTGVPQFMPGLIKGEGSTLTDMSITLMSQRRFEGRVVMVNADSGSVTDTLLVHGSWYVRRYMLTLDYSWSDTRSRSERTERQVGQIGKSGFTLPAFAGLGPRYFRRPVKLAFRRMQ